MSQNYKDESNSKLLIIHAGADKCASSSLQSSLGVLNKRHPELQDYQFLRNNLLLKKNDPKAEEKDEYIRSIFRDTSSNSLIVSNEGLMGESLPSLKLLCKTALEDHNFEQVIITMYTRSPASHAISSYHQWFFRNKETLKNDIKITNGIGLNSNQLTPLERRLITIFSKSQSRNWYSIVSAIKAETNEFGEKVRLISNHIPTKENNYSLLYDFLNSTTIIDKYAHIYLSDFDKRSNDRFATELTHALSIVLCDYSRSDIFAPGPHELNHFLMALSLAYKESENSFNENLNQAYAGSQQNLKQLAYSIDEIAREGTTKYCKEFGLNTEQFFQVNTDIELPIIDYISKNTSERDGNDIKEFNLECVEKLSRIQKKIMNNVTWMQFAKKIF